MQSTGTDTPAASTCSVSPNPASIGGVRSILVFATVATIADEFSIQCPLRPVASVHPVPSWTALSSLPLFGMVYAPTGSLRRGAEGRSNLLQVIVLLSILIAALGCAGVAAMAVPAEAAVL